MTPGVAVGSLAFQQNEVLRAHLARIFPRSYASHFLRRDPGLDTGSASCPSFALCFLLGSLECRGLT